MEESLEPSVLLTDENKGFGGAERHVVTLGKELHCLGVLQAVVARQNSWLAGNLDGAPLHPVGFRNEVDMLSVFSIYRKLKSSGANVLHCIGHRDLVASALARQLPGAPASVLVKAEHSYPDDNLSPLFRWAYGQCQAISCVSEALQRSVQNAIAPGGSVKQVVIPNGIEKTAAAEPVPPRAGRPLHVGVLSPLRSGKGHRDFLRAAALVKEDGGLRFSIAGEGELMESLQAEATELGLEVEFLGHLECPGEYLNSLDLSVVPSHRETFSLVTLETMFAGRPIVAADSEGVAELCRDYPATLYPVGEVEALAEALREFCHRPEERLEAALEASVRAAKKFGSRKMALAYKDLYQELLDSRGKSD